MTERAAGTFAVKLTPETVPGGISDPMMGQRTLDKTFAGDLEAKSAGSMLSVGTAVAGSAGYVAIETVTGTLKGRAGTFALQHFGIMTRGGGELKVTVVPDSGTGALVGLEGSMNIRIADGKHFYELDYTLP